MLVRPPKLLFWTMKRRERLYCERMDFLMRVSVIIPTCFPFNHVIMLGSYNMVSRHNEFYCQSCLVEAEVTYMKNCSCDNMVNEFSRPDNFLTSQKQLWLIHFTMLSIICLNFHVQFSFSKCYNVLSKFQKKKRGKES